MCAISGFCISHALVGGCPGQLAEAMGVWGGRERRGNSRSSFGHGGWVGEGLSGQEGLTCRAGLKYHGGKAQEGSFEVCAYSEIRGVHFPSEGKCSAFPKPWSGLAGLSSASHLPDLLPDASPLLPMGCRASSACTQRRPREAAYSRILP